MTSAQEIEFPQVDLSSPDRFINRELSWLAFNQRVLEESLNRSHPLLERLRFLSISASNLDEFYMVRVAGLKAQVRAGITTLSDDNLSPAQQLAAVNQRVIELMRDQQNGWRTLRQELREAGITVVDPSELTDTEIDWLEDRFLGDIFPILTPIAVDPAHPFPFIPNLGFSLALQLYNPDRSQNLDALLPMPSQLERFIRLPGTDVRFVLLEQLVLLFLDRIFPAPFKLTGHGVFRILRDSEMEIDEEAEDLVRTFESALKRRRRGSVIRFAVNIGMAPDLREFLRNQLHVSNDDVFVLEGLIGLSETKQLIVEERPDLVFPPYNARFPERIRDFGGDCFAAIRHKDIVVHHPYESFDVVVQFLRQAARDPCCRRDQADALPDQQEFPHRSRPDRGRRGRQDRHRDGGAESPLRRGSQHPVGARPGARRGSGGLRLRRSEDPRQGFAGGPARSQGPAQLRPFRHRQLPPDHREGLHRPVVLHLRPGALPRRGLHVQLHDRLRDPEVAGEDRHRAAGMRDKLVEMIDREIAFARAGKPAHIWLKLNSLVDPQLIDKLYKASNHGVRIDMIIRGICCLRPGVPGMSDNIRVKSIVGRFLEHGRVICFGNGHSLPSPEAKVYISSADWMPRNLDRRIETLVPIENPTVHQQILDQIMVANLKDEAQSWYLASDGVYHRAVVDKDAFSAHTYFMTNPSLSGRGSATTGARIPPRLVLQSR